MAEVRTKRWNDPIARQDGTRVLVCRYRPRGVAKADESWNEWRPQLGPSKELHAWAYGKGGTQTTWETYRRSYLREMTAQTAEINKLASRVAGGETITLLCSTACERESRCHRSLLRELVEARLQDLPPGDAMSGI